MIFFIDDLRSDDHLGDTKLVVLLFSAFVDLNFDLRVILRSVGVVNEAVGESIIQDKSEWSITFDEFLDLDDEFTEQTSVLSTISGVERIDFFELVRDLSEQSFNCSVDTSKSTWLQLKVDLRNDNSACVTLEDISVDINRVLHVESDLASLGRNSATLLNLSTLMTTSLTVVCHDNDLFEIGNCGAAHLD